MFKGDYTPGSISSIISGKKIDKDASSQLFNKPAKKITSVVKKNDVSKSSKEAVHDTEKPAGKHKEKISKNEDKVKSLKQLAKSEKKKDSTEEINKDINAGAKVPKLDKSSKQLAKSEKKKDATEEINKDVKAGPKKVPRLDRTEQRKRAKEIKKSIAEKNKRSVFVGNLPTKMQKKDLEKLFRKFGPIDSVRFRNAAPANPKMPKKGVVATGHYHEQIYSLNGYVVFTEETSAKNATKMNGFQVEDHHIRVDTLAENKTQHDHSRSIFVGNLPFDAKDEDIRRHFEDCGEITNVRLVRDNFTRLGKGFGFVLFEEKGSALLALKLDGEKCNGRKLRVQRSTAMTTKSTSDKKKKDDKHHNSPKKRKRTDTDSDAPSKKAKSEAFVNRFSAETVKFKSKHKEKLKKKSKQRIVKKRKQKLANILTGNKPAGVKKTHKRESHLNKTARVRKTGHTKKKQ